MITHLPVKYIEIHDSHCSGLANQSLLITLFKCCFDIVLPKGERITYVSEDKFDFPLGTIFIKNFYYPADFRVPEENWNIIETRLLVHTIEGWTGYPYIWDNEQTDAYLEIAGGRQNVSWIDKKGISQSGNYRSPNFNMC